jgi:hypothetical protein
MPLIRELRDNLRVSLKLTTSFASAAVFASCLVTLLVIWRDGMILLGALVGTALGWAIGILLAPYPEEQKGFQRLSKGIAGFLGGYVAAKLDRVFDLLMDKTGGGPLILNLRVVRSISVGIACLIVASVTVFVARTYFQTSEG